MLILPFPFGSASIFSSLLEPIMLTERRHFELNFIRREHLPFERTSANEFGERIQLEKTLYSGLGMYLAHTRADIPLPNANELCLRQV